MKYCQLNTGLAFVHPDQLVQNALFYLNLVEESIISIVSPLVSIHRTDGMHAYFSLTALLLAGQHKTTGNVCFFMNWEAISQAAHILPRHVKDCQVVFSYPNSRLTSYGRTAGYTVRPSVVREALLYLCRENKLYQDNRILIDDAYLHELEDEFRRRPPTLDEAVGDDEDGESNRRGSTIRYTGMINQRQLPLQGSSVSNIGSLLRVNIERRGEPCNRYTEGQLLAMCFPSLFPVGKGGDYRYYESPLTTAEFLHHCMMFGDPRFTRHYRYFGISPLVNFYRFLFMMVNIKNLDSAKNSMNACLNGRAVTRDNQGNLIDITDKVITRMTDYVCEFLCIFDSQEFERTKLFDKMIRKHQLFFTNVRGSYIFWESKKRDILSMIKELGNPTAFVTLSAADLYWTDLIIYLKSYVVSSMYSFIARLNNERMTAQDVKNMSFEARKKLLNENQVLASQYFVRRLKIFMNKIVKDEACCDLIHLVTL